MDINFFSRRVNAFQERIASLYNDIEGAKQEPKIYIKESFFELLKALEELQTAEEELTVQVTELEHIRQQAELEHANYLNLLQFSPDGYLITDNNGVIREANPAASQMLHKAMQYLVGKPLVTWIEDQDRKAFRTHINRILQHGSVENFEMRMNFHKQNTGAIFSFAAGPVRGETGIVVAVRWMIRDVTRFREAEYSLEEHRSRFQTLFKNSTVGIQLLDQSGYTIVANPAARRLLGYNGEGSKRLSFVDYVLQEDLEKLVIPYSQLARREIERFRVEARLTSKAHGVIWARISVARYQNANDPTGFAIAILEDITEQKVTGQKLSELEESVHKKTQALRKSIAQDLRTGTLEDLALILHRMENITQPDPEQVSELEEIRMALQYVISNLTEKINHLSTSSAIPFDLKEAITAYMDQVKWEHPSINCTIDYDSNLASIPEAIRVGLFNIFSVIIENRVHQANPSWFEIHAQRRQGTVVLEIQDDGPTETLPVETEALIREGQFEYAQAIEQAEALHGHISADGEMNSRSTIQIVTPMSEAPVKEAKASYEKSAHEILTRNGQMNNKSSRNKLMDQAPFDLPEVPPQI